MTKNDILKEVEVGTAKLAGKIAGAIDRLANQCEAIAEQIAALNEKHKQLVGKPYLPQASLAKASPKAVASKAASVKSKRSAKKRIRRSPEELKKIAARIVDFVKSKKDGVSASELKKAFGTLIPSVRAFVKQWAGVTIKSSGAGLKTKYQV